MRFWGNAIMKLCPTKMCAVFLHDPIYMYPCCWEVLISLGNIAGRVRERDQSGREKFSKQGPSGAL